MTQVISLITKGYVLLASDRRLTIGVGPRRGDVADDDTCKLVSVCNTFGIGYSGLAEFEGLPTHKWIAQALASRGCREALPASEILKAEASRIFSKLKLMRTIRQEFLMTGWGRFRGLSGLQPYMRLISNVRDESGRALSQPTNSFANLVKVLAKDAPLICQSLGQPVGRSRGYQLLRNLRGVVRRGIGPSAALRLLIEEIVNTSVAEKNSAVGSKILAFCIPKSSVQRLIETRHSAMIAKQPGGNNATFTYFEPGFSGLRQYGPTYVCGETAYTDVQTENDPSRKFQSVQIRILSLPKTKR
ncbi:MAG: hypothetical protein WCF88_15660 [Candidatus Acidiferrales bacterium]|jgi:hypothetical protein